MRGGYILCAIAGAPLLGGCWETARHSWARETTVVKYNYVASHAEAQAGRPADAKQASIARAKQPVQDRAAKEKGSDCATADHCALRLKAMVEDPSRNWMKERPSSTVYANGTRQFAYRALRPSLSCAELAYALQDITAANLADQTRRPKLTGDQSGRVQALNTEVASELREEMLVRCPAN